MNANDYLLLKRHTSKDTRTIPYKWLTRATRRQDRRFRCLSSVLILTSVEWISPFIVYIIICEGVKINFCIECNLLIYLENIYHIPWRLWQGTPPAYETELGHVGIGWDTSQAILLPVILHVNVYHENIARARYVQRLLSRPLAFYHSREYRVFRIASKRAASTRVGVFVDYAAGPDKMEHADRSVKQSIVMSSRQLLANVTIIISL